MFQNPQTAKRMQTNHSRSVEKIKKDEKDAAMDRLFNLHLPERFYNILFNECYPPRGLRFLKSPYKQQHQRVACNRGTRIKEKEKKEWSAENQRFRGELKVG